MRLLYNKGREKNEEEEKVKCSYWSFVFEMSLYYILIMIGLPLVYAVTYHFPFGEVYTTSWFMISLMIYPIIFILSGVRYGYHRLKRVSKI